MSHSSAVAARVEQIRTPREAAVFRHRYCMYTAADAVARKNKVEVSLSIHSEKRRRKRSPYDSAVPIKTSKIARIANWARLRVTAASARTAKHRAAGETCFHTKPVR